MRALSGRLRRLEQRLAPKVDAQGRISADVLWERRCRRLVAEGMEPDETHQGFLNGCRTAAEILMLRFRKLGQHGVRANDDNHQTSSPD